MRRARLIALLPALFGCSDLKVLDSACETGSDCVYPRVCCSAPRLPEIGQQVPFCEQISSCDAYLPFLVEGNPCLRGGDPNDVFQQCVEGLSCCRKSFTCQTEETCAALPDPPALSSSNAECVRDTDCVEGEVCWGISLRARDGHCVALSEATVAE